MRRPARVVTLWRCLTANRTEFTPDPIFVVNGTHWVSATTSWVQASALGHAGRVVATPGGPAEVSSNWLNGEYLAARRGRQERSRLTCPRQSV